MMNATDREIAEAALRLPKRLAGIVGDEEILLWHLIRSLLEYCDHKHLEFNRIVSEVKADFRSE